MSSATLRNGASCGVVTAVVRISSSSSTKHSVLQALLLLMFIFVFQPLLLLLLLPPPVRLLCWTIHSNYRGCPAHEASYVVVDSRKSSGCACRVCYREKLLTMGGGGGGRASPASLEQADALLFAAAGDREAGGRTPGRSGTPPWQQQKLRDSPEVVLAVSAESEASVLIAVLGLLFGLSVCGCIFFFFLSCLFLGALDTLSLPLATKRAAGRASLGAAMLHLASVILLGALLNQQHPEEAVRRLRSLLVSLGKRAGRALVTSGGYLLIRGTRVARDCWIRLGANTDAVVGNSHSSGGIRSRGRSPGRNAAVALTGENTRLPYCSGENDTGTGRLPTHTFRIAPVHTNYDRASFKDNRFTCDQFQQQHDKSSWGCPAHHASYTALTSFSPLAMAAAGHKNGDDYVRQSASPSPGKSWGQASTTAASGHAAAMAPQRDRDGGGGILSGDTPSPCISCGSSSERFTTRPRESSLDSSAGRARPGDAKAPAAPSCAANNAFSDNLLLLASPSPTPQISPLVEPPFLAARTPPVTPAGAGLTPAGVSGPDPLVNPAAVCWALPPASMCTDARARPGIHADGKGAASETGGGNTGLCHNSSATSTSGPYESLHTQRVRGPVAAVQGSSINSCGNSPNIRDMGSRDNHSGGLDGLWPSKSGVSFQQQQVSCPRQQAEHWQDQQQPQQLLLPHVAVQQLQTVQQGQAQRTLQKPHTTQPQRGQHMQLPQPTRQQQYSQMQFSQVGWQNLHVNSNGPALRVGHNEASSSGLCVPAAAARSSYVPVVQEVFARSEAYPHICL